MEAYESFPNDLLQEESFYQFTWYAFQKVKWGILDELIKKVRRDERDTLMPKDWEPMIADETSTTDSNVLMWDLYKSMLACLTEGEQIYSNDAVIHQLSVTAIAKKRGVSRKPVYAWRKRVGEKMEQYKTELER